MAEEFRAQGFNGALILDGNKIRIERKGAMSFLGHGFKGDKEILIKHISAIQLKKASFLLNQGYIQFSFIGGQESKAGLLKAGSDENTVVFKPKQQPDFEKIKEMIEEKLDGGTVENTPAKSSNLDELKKLAELKKEGVITDEEFNLKKKELLNL